MEVSGANMGPWSVRNWPTQQEVSDGNREGAEHTWRCQQLGVAGVQDMCDYGEQRGQTLQLEDLYPACAGMPSKEHTTI